MHPHDNRAWFLIAPAVLLLVLVGGLPLLAVINYGFHDIFTLSDVHWVGVDWFADILGSDRFLASLGRSLLFSTLALAIQVPLGIGVALLLLGYGRYAVWGLMLVALPLVVPWNMIPMLWLGLIQPETGLLGPGLAALGFDWKFTGWHTWALILTMDTWHWLGLVVGHSTRLPPGRRHRRGLALGRLPPYRAAAHHRHAGDRLPPPLCR
jgi:glycerol transport system permease protein